MANNITMKKPITCIIIVSFLFNTFPIKPTWAKDTPAFRAVSDIETNEPAKIEAYLKGANFEKVFDKFNTSRTSAADAYIDPDILYIEAIQIGFELIPEDNSKVMYPGDVYYGIAASICPACIMIDDNGIIGLAHLTRLGSIEQFYEETSHTLSLTATKQQYLERVFENIMPNDPALRRHDWTKALIILPETFDSYFASMCDEFGPEEASRAKEFMLTEDDIVNFIEGKYGDSKTISILTKAYDNEANHHLSIIAKTANEIVVDVLREELSLSRDIYDMTTASFSEPVTHISFASTTSPATPPAPKTPEIWNALSSEWRALPAA